MYSFFIKWDLQIKNFGLKKKITTSYQIKFYNNCVFIVKKKNKRNTFSEILF